MARLMRLVPEELFRKDQEMRSLVEGASLMEELKRRLEVVLNGKLSEELKIEKIREIVGGTMEEKEEEDDFKKDPEIQIKWKHLDSCVKK